MTHRATEAFWRRYRALPADTQTPADKAFQLIQANPRHPSLQFKRVGDFWSARIDSAHRALAVPNGEDFIWVWVGSHDEYERLIRSRS